MCLETHIPFRFLRHLPNCVAHKLIAFLKLDIVIGEREAAFDSFLHRLDIVAQMLQRGQCIYAHEGHTRIDSTFDLRQPPTSMNDLTVANQFEQMLLLERSIGHSAAGDGYLLVTIGDVERLQDFANTGLYVFVGGWNTLCQFTSNVIQHVIDHVERANGNLFPIGFSGDRFVGRRIERIDRG